MTYCIFSDLRHYEVSSSTENIGRIHDVYLDDQSWKVRWFVVETGHWFSSNKVLLDPRKVLEVSPETRNITVSASKESIQNAPSAEQHPPVSDQNEQKYNYIVTNHDTLLFTGYAGAMMPPTLVERAQTATSAEQELQDSVRQSSDRHLRSASELDGYTVSAIDDTLGPLSDLVINSESWTIDLLALDTSKWLPGRTVVISPQSVDKISWDERKLMVKMDKETIEQSPELGDLKSIETSYISRLNEFYRYPMVY
ncbi:PRC-barrel domain-containing protein [Granulosicoccus antarcticus]|uniref:PRC-barrel domain-containing protein n=1 Tax=Granulosicoccus antarcticus IMCC3135 TaxID=1192854 RepID=A0A2Z2NM00_9GAMM|nr:PRC-barrel domain-containing protein [Granulosicoccus antarcticus]ASJ70798.1 hypothetical protein IMCC3135_03425 [Granulosicoccus antarcticus IMCC3135]